MTTFTYVEFLKKLGWVLVSKTNSHGKALETKAETTKKNKDVEVVVLENLYNPTDKWELWEKVKVVSVVGKDNLSLQGPLEFRGQ